MSSTPGIPELEYLYLKSRVASSVGALAPGTAVPGYLLMSAGVAQAPANVLNRPTMTVQVDAIGTSHVQLSGSVDGVTYYNVGSAITANGVTTVTGNYLALKATLASGTDSPNVRLLASG